MTTALQKYLREIHVPNPFLMECGPVSRTFIRAGITTFWDAIEYVKHLPYARTSDRSKYLSVLEEKRGVCSTKHALLAALGQELAIPFKLILGIFFIDSQNNPKLVTILDKYGLKAIPEAHCFLQLGEATLDISFPKSEEYHFTLPLQKRFVITPENIGNDKISVHQSYMKDWAKINGHTFEEVWKAREEWIHQLSLEG